MIEIKNDPISGVINAFQQLYPHVSCEIWYDDRLPRHGKNRRCGETLFPDDGTVPIISIRPDIPFSAVPEIMAHELAHAAAPDDDKHSEKWTAAYDAIYDRYNKNLESKCEYSGEAPMDGLKPCPFCGGDADMAYKKGLRINRNEWIIHCHSCNIEISGAPDWAVSDLLAVWNRRAGDEAVDD